MGYVGGTVVKLLFEKGVRDPLPTFAGDPDEPSPSSVRLVARGVDGGSVAGGVIVVTVVCSSVEIVAFNFSSTRRYPA
jgi:hypothetical protein